MRKPFALAVIVVITPFASCFAPDVPALEDKMVNECRLAPAMPQCAAGDEELSGLFVDDYFHDKIRSPAAEECFLAIDCDWTTREVTEIIGDMQACERLAPSQPALPFAERDCPAQCGMELFTCGGSECDAAEAQACLDTYHGCKSTCQWVPFAAE